MDGHTDDRLVMRPFATGSVLPTSDRWLRWGAFVLLGSLGVGVALANALQVDTTVRAYGEVRPLHSHQLVVAPITGTIENLHVNENDQVIAKQALVDLRSISSATNPVSTTSETISLRRIGAPVAGTVLKLTASNLGQPVQAGTVIAEIVPTANDVIVKAFVSPTEISRITPEQPVKMQVSAYPYPEYGLVEGTITTISPDTVPCEFANCRISSGYRVDIQIPVSYLEKGDRHYTLQPGMVVTADIVTQREKLLTLILRKLRLQPQG